MSEQLGRRGNMVVRRNATPAADDDDAHHWWFWCPGCEEAHMYVTPRWERSGPYDAPTFAPSLLVRYHGADGDARCHLFLRDGQLRFLDDCTHALAGQTVPLPPPPAWLVGEGEPHA